MVVEILLNECQGADAFASEGERVLEMCGGREHGRAHLLPAALPLLCAPPSPPPPDLMAVHSRLCGTFEGRMQNDDDRSQAGGGWVGGR